MLTKSPEKMEDLRHVDTSGIDPAELRELQEQAKRSHWQALLGDRWIAAKANAPKRGSYNPITGARLA